MTLIVPVGRRVRRWPGVARKTMVGWCGSRCAQTTPTPWGTPTWTRKYKARTALERINSRIDQGYGFESHYIRGRAKMTLRVNLSMCVMMALALTSVDQPAHMRSLVKRPAFRDTG